MAHANDTSAAPIVTVERGRVTFRVDALFERTLGGRIAAQAPDAWPELAVVKSSTVRTVLAGELALPGGILPVHVKLYRPVRLSDRAREPRDVSRACTRL
jgi:hypothetical protein